MHYAESANGPAPSSLTEVNGLFELYTEGGHTSYRNMIAAPTGVVAVYTVRDDSLVKTRCHRRLVYAGMHSRLRTFTLRVWLAADRGETCPGTEFAVPSDCSDSALSDWVQARFP